MDLSFQVDVMALMSWWDLTIDIISCINLVLCIGLCVDYSAHIGLHFMQVSHKTHYVYCTSNILSEKTIMILLFVY